jgi:hypothetical protein
MQPQQAEVGSFGTSDAVTRQGRQAANLGVSMERSMGGAADPGPALQDCWNFNDWLKTSTTR